MKILGIDTSTDRIGICIKERDEIIMEIIKKIEFRSVEELFPILHDLKKKGIEYEEVEGVGITTGPGNFTSLRVGIAFVKILSYRYKIPIASLVTLDVLGYQMKEYERGIALIKAYGGKLYTSQYSYGKRIDEYSVKSPDEILIGEKTAIAGNGIHLIKEKKKSIIVSDHILPHKVCELAEELIKEEKTTDPLLLKPFYLQKIKAEEKLYQ